MTSALLVMDFINDIVHPQGKIARSADFVKAQQVIEQANRAIEIARQKNYLIIFVKIGFSKNYVEWPKNSLVFGKAKELQALQLNSWGTEFHQQLNINAQDLIIIKHRVSAFYGTCLNTVLHANQIDTLWLSGVATDMVITSTVREAHDCDYQVNILADACAAADKETHHRALTLLERVAKISKVDELVNKLNY